MTDRAKSQARTLHQEAPLEITADDHRPWTREEDEGPGSERFYWYIGRCPLGGCSQKSWPWKWGCWSYNGPDSCRARLAQHLMGHPAHNLESNRAVAFVNGMKDDNIVMKSQCFKEREKERRETALWIQQCAEAQQQEDEAAQREQRPDRHTEADRHTEDECDETDRAEQDMKDENEEDNIRGPVGEVDPPERSRSGGNRRSRAHDRDPAPKLCKHCERKERRHRRSRVGDEEPIFFRDGDEEPAPKRRKSTAKL